MKECASISTDYAKGTLTLNGYWQIDSIDTLLGQMDKLPTFDKELVICAESVAGMDSAGALLLFQLIDKIQAHGKVSNLKASDSVKQLLALVAKTLHQKAVPVIKKTRLNQLLELIGKEALRKKTECEGFLAMVGELMFRFTRGFVKQSYLSFASIVRVVELAGVQALPIIALLSFLVGVVLAYQMGLQLESYGANIYIVYLTGMANLREFSPLISAIIVAGRSSSSFTAELGSMKVNEEIDALKTMGLPPMELLILPKVIGMFIAFPLLVFWSDIFAMLGSMIMSKFMLHIPFLDFVHRFRETLGVKQLFLGLSKAPVFALVIALVGCYQGLQVKGSADSIGILTTKAVVQAIFLIIITDAMFSILFSSLGL